MTAGTVTVGYTDSFGNPRFIHYYKSDTTLSMVYNGHREIGLVLASNFFPEKTSRGH